MVIIKNKNITKVYDKNFELLAFLDNASNITYTTKMNELWIASFMMPSKDIKNKYLKAFNYVEIFENGKRIELFRIMPSRLEVNEQGYVTYECEHVIATLMDNILFGYHQIGNIGVYTPQVLRYIIDKQYTWKLGRCDFNRQFEYKWENENLLSALFSVPQPFLDKYIWTWDTTAMPFTLNLILAENEPSCEIRYKKNMTGIVKESDPTNIVTRLYCLGYGEGDNQLNIKSVNNNIPYLQAEQSIINQWGIKESVFVDRRFENAEILKAQGQAILNELKNPYISYEVGAIDLSKLTESSYDSFRAGKMVHVVDKEDEIEFDAYIVETSKTLYSPDVNIVIANKSRSIAGSISELQNRARINDTYAQGSTNMYAQSFSDNADNANPAVLRVFIPQEAVRINKLLLRYEIENFRAYSKAIEGGGAATSGPSSKQTTMSGGGATSSPSSRNTTESGGGTTSESSSRNTTESGGGDTSGIDGNYKSGGGHNHGISEGTQLLKVGGGSVTFVQSGEHTHRIYDHSHYMDHTHTIRSHNHDMDHTHNLPEHTHDMDHEHRMSPHTHAIQFGIYQGNRADFATLRIDGKVVNTTDREVNIIPHLAKDNQGKITRGSWHTIEIIPNKLTRISASVFLQTFLNSRGAGDF